jgi:hypothetical protein
MTSPPQPAARPERRAAGVTRSERRAAGVTGSRRRASRPPGPPRTRRSEGTGSHLSPAGPDGTPLPDRCPARRRSSQRGGAETRRPGAPPCRGVSRSAPAADPRLREQRSFADDLGKLLDDAEALFRPTVTRSSGEPRQLSAGAGIGYSSLALATPAPSPGASVWTFPRRCWWGAPYCFPGCGKLQPIPTRPTGRIHLAGDYLGTLCSETAIASGMAAATAAEGQLN